MYHQKRKTLKMSIWTLHSQSLRIWNGIRATFWGLTRHSYFSASTLFNHKLGLTNQHAGRNCVFWIARNIADSLVKAVALVRFRKVENLEIQLNGCEKIYFHNKKIALSWKKYLKQVLRPQLNVDRNLCPSIAKQNSFNRLLRS